MLNFKTTIEPTNILPPATRGLALPRWVRLFVCMLVLPVAACDPVQSTSRETSAQPALLETGAGPAMSSGVDRTYSGPTLSDTPFKRMIVASVNDNPGSRASISRIAAASATVIGASGAFRPRVSLGADYGVQLTGNDENAGTAPYVQLSQLLFDAGASKNRRAAAEARLDERRGDHVVFRSGLAFRAVESYFDIRRHRELVALSAQNVALHRTFLKRVETRVAARAGSQTDALAARSRLADASSRAVSGRAELDRAESVFVEVFGVVPGSLPVPPAAPAMTRGDVARIADRNPRVVALDSAILAAEADLRTASAGRFPSVKLGVTGRPDDDSGLDVNASLSVSYALTTGGEREAGILAAQANLQELRATRQELLRETERSVAFVRSDQQAMALQLEAANSAVDANRANAEAYVAQFELGRRSIADVLDAQSDYIEAKERLINAQADLSLSGYALLAVTGDILGVFGMRLLGTVPQ